MKPWDDQLNRLIKSAAAAPVSAPGDAPFALETRVISAWRESRRADTGEFLVVWFRRAAICGCVLALVSLAWNFQSSADQTGAELAIAKSALGMGVEP